MATRRDDDGGLGSRGLVLGTLILLIPIAVALAIGLQHRAGAPHAVTGRAAAATASLPPWLQGGPPYLGDRGDDSPKPQPTPAPHCSSADVSFTVSATLSSVAVDFRRITQRFCAFPQDCNVAYDVEDATGRSVAHADAGVCDPVYFGETGGDESHTAALPTCLPPGTYRVQASYTPEWQGATTLAVPPGGSCGW